MTVTYTGSASAVGVPGEIARHVALPEGRRGDEPLRTAYRRRRENAPLAEAHVEGYGPIRLITRYADIVRAEKQPAVFAAGGGGAGVRPSNPYQAHTPRGDLLTLIVNPPAPTDSSTRLTVSDRIERAFSAVVPIGVLLMFVGLLVAGYIPALPAYWSAEKVADFYRDNTNLIRFGIILTLVGFMVWGPLITVILRQMLRIRPEQKALAYLQFGAGLAAWQFLWVPMLVLAAASFRPERSPEVTQTLHDLGWILLFMPFMPFVLQSGAIALAVLLDTGPKPVFPRWVAYFNVLECFLFMAVILMLFFKTGPFAYHGVLVYWIPLFIFGVWLLVMAWATYRGAVEEQARRLESASGAYAG
ncbi:hypothetical protein [Frankia sp. CiP1_Cm_nod1]|uniref:hypothetical protein n=1 Tax=Frankia sp. CiP1_Cm_nod1 TaxID=2897160 RepID=UPI0020259F7E